MKYYRRWEEATVEERMEVYQAYLKDHEENEGYGFDLTASFEEFDAAYRFSIFQYIRSLYIKSA